MNSTMLNVATDTGKMTFVLAVGAAIQIICHQFGLDLNNDQAAELAILVAPFVLIAYHRAGVSPINGNGTSANPPVTEAPKP